MVGDFSSTFKVNQQKKKTVNGHIPNMEKYGHGMQHVAYEGMHVSSLTNTVFLTW